MRIYAPVPEVLQALRGSNIELMVGVANEDLQSIGTDMTKAYSWVQTNIISYGNVKFRYIAVGNEINPPAWEANYLVGAMKNIHQAITEAGLANRIKVSTPFSAKVLGESYPPSKGSFRPEFRSFINPIVSFLVDTGAPFLFNMYPYFSYSGNTQYISLEYALFTSHGVTVQDGWLDTKTYLMQCWMLVTRLWRRPVVLLWILLCLRLVGLLLVGQLRRLGMLGLTTQICFDM